LTSIVYPRFEEGTLMANEQQYKLHTKFVATRGVKEYRATIPALVQRRDTVLELGCAWGNTTRILAQHCRAVIGGDISAECIQRAQALNPGLTFHVLDAFDICALLALKQDFTKIYIDLSGISGYRSLLDGIALLSTYAAVLTPEIIVVKSGALKQFARHCYAWSGSGVEIGLAVGKETPELE
jgi:tRNA/tmRNA/rRNA uracil-C5-methylase (TrmA/RlmC/RlmD family)